MLISFDGLLEVSETLVLELPIEPKGTIAGMPIVVFRAIVIFGVVASVKMCFDARNMRYTR